MCSNEDLAESNSLSEEQKTRFFLYPSYPGGEKNLKFIFSTLDALE